MATSQIPLEEGQDLYGLLDVRADASVEVLRVAYRKAIRRAHPDKGGTSEAFLAVSRAFDVLSNPETRSAYDAKKEAKPRKRRREEPKTCRQAESLSNLHEILRSMDAASRRTCILKLSMETRARLVKFMEVEEKDKRRVREKTEKTVSTGSSSIRLRCVTSRACSRAKKYSAQMDIDCLRSYTRQGSFDVAIEHQLVLSDLRDKLVAADPSIWSPPFKVCEIFQQVLSAHQTSAKQLGLSVFVQLRASEWVANRHSLTSPVVSFADAVALRFRLLSAATWPQLRQEWLGLLQSGRKKLAEDSAILLVDTARAEFLQQKFQNAVKQVERAMAIALESPEEEALEMAKVVPYLSAEVLKIHTVQERTRNRMDLQRSPSDQSQDHPGPSG